jgi:hypothetical protein
LPNYRHPAPPRAHLSPLFRSSCFSKKEKIKKKSGNITGFIFFDLDFSLFSFSYFFKFFFFFLLFNFLFFSFYFDKAEARRIRVKLRAQKQKHIVIRGTISEVL